MDVEVYYIAEVFGPSSTLRPKLEVARDDLLTNDLTFGQVLDVTALSWAATLPPNEIFLAKRMAHRAGKLVVKCLVGEVLIQR